MSSKIFTVCFILVGLSLTATSLGVLAGQVEVHVAAGEAAGVGIERTARIARRFKFQAEITTFHRRKRQRDTSGEEMHIGAVGGF